jgi:hypothetical protein
MLSLEHRLSRDAPEWAAKRSSRLAIFGLVALAAIMVDAPSPAANLYLSRCATSRSMLEMTALSLRLDEHIRAFPWSMGVMTVMCATGGRMGRRAWLHAITLRICLMALTMPVVCQLAWVASSAATPAWRATTYAAMMLASACALDALMHRCPGRRSGRPAAYPRSPTANRSSHPSNRQCTGGS